MNKECNHFGGHGPHGTIICHGKASGHNLDSGCNPDCYVIAGPRPASLTVKGIVPVPHPGIAIWQELHTATPETALGLYAGLVERVAGMGCGCGPSLAAYLAEHVPCLETTEECHDTAWKLHNFVNAKLNRPVWTKELCNERWSAIT